MDVIRCYFLNQSSSEVNCLTSFAKRNKHQGSAIGVQHQIKHEHAKENRGYFDV